MRAALISDTDYPAVRRVMGHDRLNLDDDALESLLEDLFPDSEPEDIESFMGTVQRFGKEAAPIAQRALPGAVQGALTGATVGGPYGALAGAALGATSGALSQPPRPTGSAPAAPQPSGAHVAQPPSLGQAPSSAIPAASQPMSPQAAAGALLEIITNPAALEALMTVLLQASGRSTVKVGAQQVPPAAFANAIAEFAAIAASADVPAESTSDYLYGETGWPRGDLANPVERAEILLNDLREAAQEAQISAYERVAYGWRTDD